MHINRVIEGRQNVEVNLKQTLRPGQIVRANISKLYSDGKALINLGNQQLVAQLEAALAVGKSYHFQVVQTDGQTIHLKVLSEVSPNQTEDLKNLLRFFNFNVTNHKLNFVRSLVEDQISFNRNDLYRAFQILKGAPHTKESHAVLKQMISRGLPITENTFHALRTVNDSDLTSLIRQLKATIQQNPSEILHDIKSLLNRPQEQMQQFLSGQISRSNETANLFRNLGLHGGSSNLHLINEQSTTISKAQPMASVNTIINTLIQNEQALIENSNNLLRNIKQFQTRMTEQIQAINIQQYEKDISSLKQEFRERILPLLSENHRPAFSEIAQSSGLLSEELTEMTRLLESLSNSQTYRTLTNFKQTINYNFPKEVFLNFLSQGVTEIGFNYENEMVNNNFTQASQSSLKGQVLHLLNTAEFTNNDQMQQVLHFINGAQIHSIQETNHFVQANLLVLGEQFGFDKDIHINFESKKTKEGKVDPSFCRILFFLDLNTLKETVIDMVVQDRLITLQIFNEQPNFITSLAKAFEHKLKESLEEMNYKLSKIIFSPFNKQKQVQGFTLKERQVKEGIDFKI